jgi:hypothetical protein
MLWGCKWCDIRFKVLFVELSTLKSSGNNMFKRVAGRKNFVKWGKKLIFDILKLIDIVGSSYVTKNSYFSNRLHRISKWRMEVRFSLFSVRFDVRSPIDSMWLNKQRRNTNFGLDNWPPDQNWNMRYHQYETGVPTRAIIIVNAVKVTKPSEGFLLQRIKYSGPASRAVDAIRYSVVVCVCF